MRCRHLQAQVEREELQQLASTLKTLFVFLTIVKKVFFAVVVAFTVINGVAVVAFMVVVVAADDAVLLSLPSS